MDIKNELVKLQGFFTFNKTVAIHKIMESKK